MCLWDSCDSATANTVFHTSSTGLVKFACEGHV